MYTIRSRYSKDSIPTMGAAYSGRTGADHPKRSVVAGDGSVGSFMNGRPEQQQPQRGQQVQRAQQPAQAQPAMRGAVTPQLEQPPRGSVSPQVERARMTLTPAQISIIAQHPELKDLIPQLQTLESQGYAAVAAQPQAQPQAPQAPVAPVAAQNAVNIRGLPATSTAVEGDAAPPPPDVPVNNYNYSEGQYAEPDPYNYSEGSYAPPVNDYNYSEGQSYAPTVEGYAAAPVDDYAYNPPLAYDEYTA